MDNEAATLAIIMIICVIALVWIVHQPHPQMTFCFDRGYDGYLMGDLYDVCVDITAEKIKEGIRFRCVWDKCLEVDENLEECR